MSKFIKYNANVERQSGMILKSIICDNGGEYSSNSFKSYCFTQGINVEYISPFTSQQNGVSERYIRSITSIVRVILCDSSLGKEYWGEALNTPVFLKNRIASGTLDWKSPYEVWFK